MLLRGLAFLTAGLVLLSCPGRAFAFSANLVVTSGHAQDIGGGLINAMNLAGEGFTFDFLQAGMQHSPDAAPPGTLFRPSTTGSSINGASLTLLGVQYRGGPNTFRPQIGGGFGPFEFTSGVLLPAAEAGKVLTFTAPFILDPLGFFSDVQIICVVGPTSGPCGNNTTPQTLDLHLTGHGTGSVTLRNDGSTIWIVQDLHYDFTAGTPPDPTLSLSPEPTTLLLWLTGVAGIGVVRRVRRRHHAA
jgi:hypothetical protein